MEYSIGIDIGGTKIAGALVDSSGHLHYFAEVHTPVHGSAGILEAVGRLVTGLSKQMIHFPESSLRGVGVGTAGQVDFKTGRVLSGTLNIHDWNNVSIRDWLSNLTDLPVYVDNDVNAMAVAESYLGAAKGHQDVVCLAMGTGVGGGVLCSGRILRGAWGGAGEMGHVSVDMNGPMCNCGMKGCLETYASGPGLKQRLLDLWNAVDDDLDSETYQVYLADPDGITSRDVIRWMRAGDAHATKVVQQMLSALSVAIVGFIHTFNPTMVVLGGGLMEDGEWIRIGVEKRISGMGMHKLVQPVEVRTASFGIATTLIGAAYQCWIYDER